jgi:hypothetical protein
MVSTVAQETPTKVCTQLDAQDVDYPGADISDAAVYNVADVYECAALCEQHELCFTFTYASWG